jgi:Peptidase propeptide and YPEB domain
MRNWIAIAALLSTRLAVAPGASAQTVGVGTPLISVGEVQDIAAMNGVVAIRKIEFYDEAWHVVGRDVSGKRVEMEVDPRTGTIAHLERFD